MTLFLIDSNGTNRRELQTLLPSRPLDRTQDSPDASLSYALREQTPAWSPDGQTLLFTSGHEDQVDVYAATLNGSLTRLTNTPDLEGYIKWAPDGTAFVCYTGSAINFGGLGYKNAGFAIVPRDGGDPLRTERNLKVGKETAYDLAIRWIDAAHLIVALGVGEVRVFPRGPGQVLTIWRGERDGNLAWSAAAQTLVIDGRFFCTLAMRKLRK